MQLGPAREEGTLAYIDSLDRAIHARFSVMEPGFAGFLPVLYDVRRLAMDDLYIQGEYCAEIVTTTYYCGVVGKRQLPKIESSETCK
jgi:hypothetical protein